MSLQVKKEGKKAVRDEDEEFFLECRTDNFGSGTAKQLLDTFYFLLFVSYISAFLVDESKTEKLEQQLKCNRSEEKSSEGFSSLHESSFTNCHAKTLVFKFSFDA